MVMDDVRNFLTKEADSLENEIKSLEIKIEKLVEKQGLFNSMEKVYKIKADIDLLRGQQFKLYELSARVYEIGNI